MKDLLLSFVIAFALVGIPPAFADSFTPAGLAGYQKQAGTTGDAQRGKIFWNSTHKAADGKDLNCATCHGEDLAKAGKHFKSGKPIEPMSRKANAERLTDAEKVEKWFTRNCKQVLQRECTAGEKSDVLLFLSQS